MIEFLKKYILLKYFVHIHIIFIVFFHRDFFFKAILSSIESIIFFRESVSVTRTLRSCVRDGKTKGTTKRFAP